MILSNISDTLVFKEPAAGGDVVNLGSVDRFWANVCNFFSKSSKSSKKVSPKTKDSLALASPNLILFLALCKTTSPC